MRLYKTQPFATCDTCSRLKQTVQLASGEEQERARGQLERHLGYVERAREAMKARAAYARAHPDEVLYINIDGMDQAKTNIPNDKVKGKSDDVGAPLTAKLLAAIAYGRGWWGFWSFPDWGASSNLTLTALCKMLRDISGRSPRASERPAPHASLPPVLHLQMDNTAKDNKNHYLVGFCGMLVAERVFQEVRVFFLPVGHTHQEIDATFSRVANGLNLWGAYCLEDLMEVTQGAWGHHEDVGTSRKVNTRFDHVLDFRRLLRYSREKRCGWGDDEEEEEAEEDGPPRMHTFYGLGTERSSKR